MICSDLIPQLLPHRSLQQKQATAFAPSNIALCKYWGKRNEELKLPVTGSLSVSLGKLGTEVVLQQAEEDLLTINGEVQPLEGKIAKRFFGFLDVLREPGQPIQCHGVNTVPTGAGLASSASAFAAIVKAMDQLCGWDLAPTQLSILARMGSGSACRSLFDGFVEWEPGTREDGLDSYAIPLPHDWPDFRIGLLTVSEAPKPVGSTEGMKRTMETAPLYGAWPKQVEQDLPRIRTAIQEQDFHTLGSTAEHNAMSMHATMIGAWPPVIYWQPESVEVLHRIRMLREQGLSVYVTMDAGPNVKLLFLKEAETDLIREFPSLQVVSPFKGEHA